MDPDRPGPHPTPPNDLSTRALPLIQVRPPWFRCHVANRDAIFFGVTGSGRFDDPRGVYGVLYLGSDPECTFIETFGQKLGVRAIAPEELAARTLSVISSSGALTLVDLTGAGLALIGADTRLVAGEHRISQL